MTTKSLSVLVADDERHVRIVIQLYLGEAGHKSKSVSSVAEGREIVKKQKFDLLITDIIMPAGDGIEMIEEFRKTNPNGRILAISGGGSYIGSDNCLNLAVGLGAHAVLMKPFNFEQLMTGIEQAFAASEDRPLS